MSKLSEILNASGTTDANNPEPGKALAAAPGTQVDENVAKVMGRQARPGALGKHKYISETEADAQSRYTLTIPRLGGWTFFLVANKPDPNTGCPTTIYPIEFGPGSTGFDDDGLADAIFDNQPACDLMERGEIILTQNCVRTFKHNTGFVLVDVFDRETGQKVEASPYAKLDPQSLRTRYVASGIKTALEGGPNVKVGIRGEGHGRAISPEGLKPNQLLGDFR
jgi:hypothetical protein